MRIMICLFTNIFSHLAEIKLLKLHVESKHEECLIAKLVEHIFGECIKQQVSWSDHGAKRPPKEDLES